MQGHFWHLPLGQLLRLFHMVALVLLFMVAFKNHFLLVKILQKPIKILEISGYWSCHGEQNAGYHVKEHRKLYQKHVSVAFCLGPHPKTDCLKQCSIYGNISMYSVYSTYLWTWRFRNMKTIMQAWTPTAMMMTTMVPESCCWAILTARFNLSLVICLSPW